MARESSEAIEFFRCSNHTMVQIGILLHVMTEYAIQFRRNLWFLLSFVAQNSWPCAQGPLTGSSKL